MATMRIIGCGNHPSPERTCLVCRCILGLEPVDWESDTRLTPEQIATIWSRKAVYAVSHGS